MQKISSFHFQEVIKKGYSLDLIYLLLAAQEGVDIIEMCEASIKIESLRTTLIRKGLITDNNKLTISGLALISFLDTKEKVKLVTKKEPNSDFDLWWKAFPGTDIFFHRGKQFRGCRSLKTKKEDCKVKINAIINEGDYTIEQLVGALDFEVLSKKNQSVESNTNKLTYMQNSLTYLNQRSFEPFIELLSTETSSPIEDTTNYGGTDI
jgi:hypothetical protein